jgi:hypothetical protein
LPPASTGPGTPDIDQDGYPDSEDACIAEPETWNKFKDLDGCPDQIPDQARQIHDQDQDGLIDDVDSCPVSPEDYDGDRDQDGCPDK